MTSWRPIAPTPTPFRHFLDATVELGAADSGVTITAAPGSKPGSVIVSGGMPLAPTWKQSTRKSTATNVIWETPVPAALRAGFKGLTTLDPHRRVTRARYGRNRLLIDLGWSVSSWQRCRSRHQRHRHHHQATTTSSARRRAVPCAE